MPKSILPQIYAEGRRSKRKSVTEQDVHELTQKDNDCGRAEEAELGMMPLKSKVDAGCGSMLPAAGGTTPQRTHGTPSTPTQGRMQD
jgi:hypothetical protein